MTPESAVRCEPVRLTSSSLALTVDLEEWYHTCLVPEFVHPVERPWLVEELEWLLPELLDLFDEWGVRATFFVLGEVAVRHPGLVKELSRRRHEVACHGFLHLRSSERDDADFRTDVTRCRDLLEQLVGRPVAGFRAPEWSLRRVDNPRLRTIAELGFEYDSSLAPWVGAGSTANPVFLSRLSWGDATLLEAPPLCLGGRWRLPASGWPARIGLLDRVPRAAERHRALGGAPVIVVHPWELTGRPTPGELAGLARFVHEAGRLGFRGAVGELLSAGDWRPLGEVLAGAVTTFAEPAIPVPAGADTVPLGPRLSELEEALAEQAGGPARDR